MWHMLPLVWLAVVVLGCQARSPRPTPVSSRCDSNWIPPESTFALRDTMRLVGTYDLQLVSTDGLAGLEPTRGTLQLFTWDHTLSATQTLGFEKKPLRSIGGRADFGGNGRYWGEQDPGSDPRFPPVTMWGTTLYMGSVSPDTPKRWLAVQRLSAHGFAGRFAFSPGFSVPLGVTGAAARPANGHFCAYRR